MIPNNPVSELGRLEINVFTVAFLAMLTAVATGLGALPFAFGNGISKGRLGPANAIAAGLMLAASAVLLWEGGSVALSPTVIGAIVGGAAVYISQRILHSHEDVGVGQLRGADARKALLIMGVMTAHSFAEGVGVGVSYGGGDELGLFITAAIALHNVPEGLAIALVLVPRGVSVMAAAGWAVVSSLPQPLLAVPAYLAVHAFAPLLPFGLGFAAGAMVLMAVLELLPEAREQTSTAKVAGFTGIAFAGGIGAQMLLG